MSLFSESLGVQSVKRGLRSRLLYFMEFAGCYADAPSEFRLRYIVCDGNRSCFSVTKDNAG